VEYKSKKQKYVNLPCSKNGGHHDRRKEEFEHTKWVIKIRKSSILTQKNKTDWMAAGLAYIYSLIIEGNIISYNEIKHTTYFTVSYSKML
jgi:hypothetical protein